MLSAVAGALINELHAGWPWWVASAVVVLAAAGLSMWLMARTSPVAARRPAPPPAGNPTWSGAVRQDVRVEGHGRAHVVGQGEIDVNDR